MLQSWTPVKLLPAAVVTAAPTAWAVRHLTSPAVDAWSPSSLTGSRVGSLYARVGGSGDRATILLHGLVSTGDVFGAAYDELARTQRVVIPDLLGFGRSMDTGRSSFPVDDHLGALDELAERSGLNEKRWTIGAHSMGSALALRWAARHSDQVDRVVCWGAPLYASPAAARSRISGSTMARLFALDTAWAERACALSCRHRTAAGWLGAAFEPTLPVPIARAVSLHTWPAYRDAMCHLVIDTDWQGELARLDDRQIPVELVWGTNDRVGDHRHAETLVARGRNTTMRLIPGEDHHLPIARPEICRGQLAAAATRR